MLMTANRSGGAATDTFVWTCGSVINCSIRSICLVVFCAYKLCDINLRISMRHRMVHSPNYLRQINYKAAVTLLNGVQYWSFMVQIELLSTNHGVWWCYSIRRKRNQFFQRHGWSSLFLSTSDLKFTIESVLNRAIWWYYSEAKDW